MTRAQRIAVARHEVFADWLFMRRIAHKPMCAQFDDLFKRFYGPAFTDALFPLHTPLADHYTVEGLEDTPITLKHFTFPLSVRR